jgi:hypothetical protein
MKKYKFKIFYFRPETLEVDLVATCTTVATTLERAHELARLECSKAARPGGACYQMVTK